MDNKGTKRPRPGNSTPGKDAKSAKLNKNVVIWNVENLTDCPRVSRNIGDRIAFIVYLILFNDVDLLLLMETGPDVYENVGQKIVEELQETGADYKCTFPYADPNDLAGSSGPHRNIVTGLGSQESIDELDLEPVPFHKANEDVTYNGVVRIFNGKKSKGGLYAGETYCAIHRASASIEYQEIIDAHWSFKRGAWHIVFEDCHFFLLHAPSPSHGLDERKNLIKHLLTQVNTIDTEDKPVFFCGDFNFQENHFGELQEVMESNGYTFMGPMSGNELVKTTYRTSRKLNDPYAYVVRSQPYDQVWTKNSGQISTTTWALDPTHVIPGQALEEHKKDLSEKTLSSTIDIIETNSPDDFINPRFREVNRALTADLTATINDICAYIDQIDQIENDQTINHSLPLDEIKIWYDELRKICFDCIRKEERTPEVEQLLGTDVNEEEKPFSAHSLSQIAKCAESVIEKVLNHLVITEQIHDQQVQLEDIFFREKLSDHLPVLIEWPDTTYAGTIKSESDDKEKGKMED